jgi:DNA primase
VAVHRHAARRLHDDLRLELDGGRLPNVPGYDVPWTEVGAADLEVRARHKATGVPSFVKTAAGKGFHIVAPVRPEYSSDKVNGGSQVADT